MASPVVRVLVMAPNLGPDLTYVSEVDARVDVLDGNRAFGAELVEQGHARGPLATGAPLLEERNQLLGDADVLLVGYPVPPRLVRRAPSLRWAHHTQAGVSNLLQSDLWTSAVPLTSSRGAVAVTAIAEFAMAGVFHFGRGLHAAVRRPAGAPLRRDGYEMSSLAGATLGVVGLGGIGQEVARLGRAVGMRVIATRRSAIEAQGGAPDVDLLLPASRLSELAAESDYMVVCSQLTRETRGMIDATVFAASKPGAVLINIARGEEIDETALIEAIRSGQLRGALLDVYDGELSGRPPRRELLETPQIILTPHISASGDRAGVEPAKRLFADNLRRFLDGRPLRNLVDRDRGY